MDDNCIKSLGEFIQNSKTIINIGLGDNVITDKGIEILLPYLIGNMTIIYLGISFNKEITDKSIPLLKESIHKSIIQCLDIFGTSITDKNILVVQLIENILKNGSDTIDMNGK